MPWGSSAPVSWRPRPRSRELKAEAQAFPRRFGRKLVTTILANAGIEAISRSCISPSMQIEFGPAGHRHELAVDGKMAFSVPVPSPREHCPEWRCGGEPRLPNIAVRPDSHSQFWTDTEFGQPAPCP